VAPRALVVERVHEALPRLLEGCGVRVSEAPGATGEHELEKLAPGYEVLVVRSRARVTRRVIEAGARGRLRVIARAGVGLDNIDLDAASEHGIQVVNAPTGSTQSVAELTLGLMIAAARLVALHDREVKAGVWRRRLGVELYGKNLLVVGFGRIGRRVSELARAIGMRVYAYDIADVRAEAERRGVTLVPSLCEGLSLADVVSLHVPLNRLSYHMVNRETLRCARPGVILVNTSRGAVVDAEALLEALEEGRVSAAALDVIEHEPPETEAERILARHPRVIVTPHIGASTLEAQERVAAQLATRILEALGVECREAAEARARLCDTLKGQGLHC